MDKVKNSISLIIMLLLFGFTSHHKVIAQTPDNEGANKPIFTPEKTTHDFGQIGETDGMVEYVFKVQNTGDAPLIIKDVQASCGCTKPEWTKTPIEPGKEGVVIVGFNPTGNSGVVTKSLTVYTNEDGGNKLHRFSFKATVVGKPHEPTVQYVDTIGGVGIQHKELEFNTAIYNISNEKFMYLKNYNTNAVLISFENIPDYITVNYPDNLKADWSGEARFIIGRTSLGDKRGRTNDQINMIVKNEGGEILGRQPIRISANIIDDLEHLTPLQRVSAGHIEIKNTILDFGGIKKGFLGLNGSKTKEFILTNSGKSELILHSVTSDDERVSLPQLKGRVLQPGESLPVKVIIKSKELNYSNINTDIDIICNDPIGPVRMVKVTAEKAAR